MRNETRQKFNRFTGKVAKLNAITSAMVQFNVQPTVQQTQPRCRSRSPSST